MEPIIIGNKKYYIHPKYISFGVDEGGNVIDIVTRNSIDLNKEEMTIRLRKLTGKSKKLKLTQYIWEAIHGVKPKNMTIIHINGDENDNRIDNLKLWRGRIRKLSDEERQNNDKECRARWKQKEWKCNRCGNIMKNNLRYHHMKVCAKEENKENKIAWKNKLFTCQICGREYKNNYKYVHIALCNKKHQNMEN